jgi:protein-S-isoprenylcysteine O-methyltransferase Ste14
MTAEKKTGEAATVASGRDRGVLSVHRFLYLTRGLWNLVALGLGLALKAIAGSSVPPWAYALLGVAVLATQGWRIWAAGFVGRTARGGRPIAESLVTAGPYAHVRNPMYLGTAIGVLAFVGMSGLWYAVLAAAVIMGVVYAGAVVYEEAFLSARFGEEYRRYREAVPRLLPKLAASGERRAGHFRLANGLANEGGALVFLPLFFALFWFVD